MKIGMVGLGKMGANMTRRLIEKGHQVVGFDLGAEARAAVACYGAGHGLEPRGAGREALGASRGLGDGARGQADRGHRRGLGSALRGW